nr:GntR family transcriptional regulator [Phaeacidiphilus oryzae]
MPAAQEPKYWYLRTVLVRTIDTEFGPGDALPNERELAARFGVARATLRQALDQLELEGRLVRRRGIGTVIAAPRMGVPVGPAATADPAAVDDGQRDVWRVVESGPAGAPAAVASELGLAAGDSVHAVRRLRVVDGRAVGTETLYVPRAVDPEAARSGPESRAVELGVAEDAEARLLERPPGSPVLVVTTRYGGGDGRTGAVAVSTYRADTCRLTFGAAGQEPVEVARSA